MLRRAAIGRCPGPGDRGGANARESTGFLGTRAQSNGAIGPSAGRPGFPAASHRDPQRERIWDYLPYGPFGSEGEFRAHLNAQAASEDPLFFAIRPRATTGCFAWMPTPSIRVIPRA